MGDLDFDAEGVDTSAADSFDVLPAGTVLTVQINSAEWKDNKKGDGAYVQIEFEAIGEHHAGRRVWEYLNLRTERTDKNANKMITIARAQLAKLAVAIGRPKLTNAADLEGGVCKIKLGVEKAKGDFPARNEVAAYLTNDEGAQAPKANGSKAAAAPAKAPWAR